MDHPRPWLRYVDADDLDDKTFDFADAEVVDPAGEKLGSVDGFIIDVNTGRPYHVVVEAGHWFKHKHFLIPIGRIGLDPGEKRLTAEVPKERVERFPGFSRGEFEKLSDEEMDRMARSMASAYGNDDIVIATSWETWQEYESPRWWDSSFYRPETSTRSSMDTIGTSAGSSMADGGASAGAADRERRDSSDRSDRERELVTAQGGDTSPYAGGRAKPGDVSGVDTGGEQTHVSDTKEDENKRRQDAERAAAKDRR
jgi:sporulation protein YlmC with PRC-barrel domain